MLKKLIKGEGYNTSEKRLIDLADNSFLGLWSYPNVFSDEGFSKNKSGKEVCDLLVVFGKDVILFSDKNIKFNQEKDLSTAWKRWYKKSVIESAKQLYGAENFIKNNPERIYLDKACKQKLPFEISEKYNFHLVIVTSNISTACRSYFDQIQSGSSGTLLNYFKLDARSSYDNPFQIGDFYPDKSFIHFFDETSLEIVLAELNTISDLIKYFKVKERDVRCNGLVLSPGEEDTLGAYLLNNCKIVSKGKSKNDSNYMVAEGEWVEYLNSNKYRYNKKMKDGSKDWDWLIQNFSNAIFNANTGIFKELDFQLHETAVRELAKETRESRYYISQSFFQKLNGTFSDTRTARLVQSTDEKGKVYLFLFLPQSPKETYEEYRLKRVWVLSAYATVAFYKYGWIDKLILLATEPKNSTGRSEELFYILPPKKMSSDYKKEARKLMNEFNILNEIVGECRGGPMPTQTHPLRNKISKTGRNDTCPCGSGVKFKKCHGQ